MEESGVGGERAFRGAMGWRSREDEMGAGV